MTDDGIEQRLSAINARVAHLEAEIRAVTKAEDRISERLDKSDKNITELLGVLNQAKGARWAFLLVVALSGAGIAEFVQRFLLGSPPGSGGS